MRLLRRRPAPAEESLLAEVFEAEKAAAAAIATAKLEADTWLTAERLAIANDRDARLQTLAGQAADDEEAARQAALADAAKIVTDAETTSRELRAIADRDLLPLVDKHVARIIPGPPS